MMAEKDWESYSGSKILYLRCISEHIFEYVAVTEPIDDNPDDLIFCHGAVYVDDYLRPESQVALNTLLTDFGYDNLTDFVQQTISGGNEESSPTTIDMKVELNGNVRYIDYTLLASLVVESLLLNEPGVRMLKAEAIRLASNVIGVDFSC